MAGHDLPEDAEEPALLGRSHGRAVHASRRGTIGARLRSDKVMPVRAVLYDRMGDPFPPLGIDRSHERWFGALTPPFVGGYASSLQRHVAAREKLAHLHPCLPVPGMILEILKGNVPAREDGLRVNVRLAIVQFELLLDAATTFDGRRLDPKFFATFMGPDVRPSQDFARRLIEAGKTTLIVPSAPYFPEVHWNVITFVRDASEFPDEWQLVDVWNVGELLVRHLH